MTRILRASPDLLIAADDMGKRLMVSAGVDLLRGNPSQQTRAEGHTEEPLPTGADNRKSDNPQGGLVEQSGEKGANRPEINGYGAHSLQQGPRAKRLDMTRSEPALTQTALGGKQSLVASNLTLAKAGPQSPQAVVFKPTVIARGLGITG